MREAWGCQTSEVVSDSGSCRADHERTKRLEVITMNPIPGRDWKILAGSRELYLKRLCVGLNTESLAILQGTEGDDCGRYLQALQGCR